MTDRPRGHNGRFAERRSRWRALRGVWRDVVPFVAIALAAWAVIGVQGQVDQQAEGRRNAIDVLCGFGNGVAGAGRASIEGGVNIGPPRFERELVQLGMAPRPARAASAQAAASAYASAIARSVAEQAHIDVKALVQKDGTLDCARLRVLAKAPAPTP